VRLVFDEETPCGHVAVRSFDAGTSAQNACVNVLAELKPTNAVNLSNFVNG
jgi:hypothetical protein